MQQERALRLVYFGRLVRYKGVHDSIEMVAGARALGADVSLDLIGMGEEEPGLRALIARHGLNNRVRLLGPMDYGARFLGLLQRYHALLFTPVVEDTPRMIFDGYAAGLPFLGTRIPFLEHRAAKDRAGWLVGVGDVAGGAREISRLCRQLPEVADRARQAREMGLFHSTENWYQRRAEWTIEAVDRHSRLLKR
jgi:glycosyltransferase involved in cell wall biosynthesis